METGEIETIKEYLKKGWSAFPVQLTTTIENGVVKKGVNFPIEDGKEGWKRFQTERLTESQIDFAWIVFEHVGIATGKISGITVVDVDTKDDILPPDFPKTYTVETRKGFHYYFKYNPNVRQTQNKVGNIDIRNDGGFVFAPPTKYKMPDGTYSEYKIINDIKPAEFPFKWYEETFKQDSNWKEKITSPITSGSRNVDFTSIIGGLLSKFPPQEWETIVWSMVSDKNKLQEKPLSQTELRNIFNSISRKESLRRAGTIEPEKEYKIISINEILDMEEKEQPFLLQGMIVEGSVNALTADSGKGKSLVALKMIEAIAKGEKFLGEFNTKKAKTLIIDLEMSENDIIQRSKSIIHDKMDGLDFYYCQTFNIENIDDYKWLTDSIINNQYKLIVFDTLSAIHEREENSNSEMNLVNKKLIELCNKYGQTVLFLHHHKKPKTGEIQNQASSRGAGAIIDKAASQILLDSKKVIVAVGEEGEQKAGLPGLRIIIEQMKRRQATGFERFGINSCFNPETKKTIFTFAGYDEKADSAIEKVITALLSKMEKGEEYLMSELKEFVGESSVLYTALKQLIEVDKKIGIRLPNDGETKNGAKIRHNSKIYYLL